MASASPQLCNLRDKLLAQCQTGKCDTETYELAKQIITREISEERLDIQFRYFILNIRRYIRLNQHRDNYLGVMISAMYYLSKYASNLLTTAESNVWRVIHLSNKLFQEKVHPMYGATQILSFMGYTESDKDCMKFPMNVSIPDQTKVSKILSDLIIAMVELKELIDCKHPNPSMVLPVNNQGKSRERTKIFKNSASYNATQDRNIDHKTENYESTKAVAKSNEPPRMHSLEKSQNSSNNDESRSPISPVTAKTVKESLLEEKLACVFSNLFHSDERVNVALNLIQFGYTEEIAIVTAKSCTDIPSALDFLNRSCGICFESFPATEMLSLSVCEHEFCKECLSKFIKLTVKESSILKINCPTCQKPDLSTELTEYFNLVDQMIRNLVKDGYLTKETHELFDTKLRDHTLCKDPLFLWCPQCSSGFYRDRFSPLKVKCNRCSCSLCCKCLIKWNELHDNVDCEDYQKKLADNKIKQQLQSILHDLEKTGLECPSCKTKFDLAKGGCMHMTCTNCMFQFCCGCKNQFHENSKSCRFPKCPIDGLHAHHPRNCLYYLRDWDVVQLQQLLTRNDKKFEIAIPKDHDGKCHIMELKEKEDSNETEETECDKEAPEGYRGVCRKHYKEYLVDLICIYRLDPVDLYDIKELKTTLSRHKISYPCEDDHDKQDYEKILRDLLQKELPLPK